MIHFLFFSSSEVSNPSDDYLDIDSVSMADENSKDEQISSDSISSDSGEAQLGQELINLLLQNGEIEENSYQNSQNGIKNRPKYIKNERYDELISAFNVILEEILEHGNLKTKNNGDESKYMHKKRPQTKYALSAKPFKSGRKVTPSKHRCLSPFEDELLVKIKGLNKQLKSIMQSAEKMKQKRHAQIPVLSRENNYGMDLRKFIKYYKEAKAENIANKENDSDTIPVIHVLPDPSEHAKYPEHPEPELEPEPEPEPEDPELEQTPTIAEGGIKIPLKLVKGPNNSIRLVLDRRSICRCCKRRNPIF